MASSSTSFPQFDEAKPSATTLLWQAAHYRPRTHRTKAIAFSVLSFLLLLWMISSSRVSVDLFPYQGCGMGHASLEGRHVEVNVVACAKRTCLTSSTNPSRTFGPSSHRVTHFLNAPKMRRSLFLENQISPSTIPSPMIWRRPTPTSMSSFRP
jgi:hypothetical protein